MDYRILGPLEVEDGGRSLPLGGARQRALLSLLLLHRGEVVPADRLIEDLYDGTPPATAAKTLQAHVSRLRKALGADGPLVTRGGGYVLEIGEGTVDADAFERLAAEGAATLGSGDAHSAVRLLKDALALWRGEPFVDVAYRAFPQSEIARLDELRILVLEELVDAQLATGRHAGVVAELERLTREHPFRERLRAQLMLALYRSGRQADALKAFKDARRALVEGLGIEPGASLRDLERRILAQDPKLDAPASVDDHAALSPTGVAAGVFAAREGRRPATILALDLVLSGDREVLDPEAVLRLEATISAELGAIVERHGGSTDGIGAHGGRAVFGIPVAHEDDALRAVRTAHAARDLVRTLPSELVGQGVSVELRAAIVTGEMVTGGAASGLGVVGEPTSLAMRLARDADAGEIVLDPVTTGLVRGAVVVQDTIVSGASAARVVELVVLDRHHVSRFASPMVGRQRERRRLNELFDETVDGRSCQLVTIVGAAGVGKSRLVQECLRDIGDRATVARGRCLPYGEGITYWPVIEVVRDLAGLGESATVDDLRRRLAELVAASEQAERLADRVPEAIGLVPGTVNVDETTALVGELFRAVAERQPLVVVFDDVHWGESTFLTLVEDVADRSHDRPVLLVCLARHELFDVRPGWSGGKVNSTSSLLEPLNGDECDSLIRNLLDSAELRVDVRARISEASGGNPLFVEETIAMLIDNGMLADRGGGWAPTRDLDAIPIPATLQALLAARLDSLPSSERDAIERASVEGSIFHTSWVFQQGSQGSIDDLESLARKGLVRPAAPMLPGERAYAFRHLLIRDAAYAAIAKTVRASLHELHAEWLLARVGGEPAELEEIVGYHLEQAFHYRAELGPVDDPTRLIGRRAAERLGTAGRRALARSDAAAGMNLVSRAIALLEPDDPLRVALVPNVRVIQGDRDLGWADRVLTEAVEAAATSGDRRLAAHALVQRGFLRLFGAREVSADELHEVSGRAIAVFEELDDQLGLARAWRLAGQGHYLDRRLERCAEATERALTHARRAADRFEEREIVEWLGIAHLLGPTPAPAAIARSTSLLNEIGDEPLVRAGILSTLAPLHAMRGDWETADRLVAESERLMDEAGERIWIATFWRAFVALWRNDPLAAEEALRPGYEALKRMGETSHFSSVSHALAEALYQQARFDECERLTQECEEACHANDGHSHILWRSIRAKALAQRGELALAEALADEAVALAAAGDLLLAHADALANRAVVLGLAGRHQDAMRSLAAAASLYEAKGNLIQATRARDATVLG